MGLSCPSKCRLVPAGEAVCGGDSDQMLPGGGNTGAGVPHGGSCFPQLHGAGPLPAERKVGPRLRGSEESFSPFHAGHPFLCSLLKAACDFGPGL